MPPAQNGFSSVPPWTPILASSMLAGALGKSDAVVPHTSPALNATQPPPTTPLMTRFAGTTLVQERDVGPDEAWLASEASNGDPSNTRPTSVAAKSEALIAHTPSDCVCRFFPDHRP